MYAPISRMTNASGGARAPALIEGGSFGIHASLAGAHPGRARPGLIEGRALDGLELHGPECIRGARAPASLKGGLRPRSIERP